MMFESVQEFKDFINANGGPRQVMMFIFNNSYTKVYGRDEYFNLNDIDEKGRFRLVETDVRKQEYVSYKALAYLEGITFAPEGVDKDTINFRNYRP